MHVLDRFFNPQSVAIVGATLNPFSNNFNLVNNLVKLGYKGRIYPINPREETIGGLKCYKSVNDIDDYIDLVAVSVPARNVLEVVKGLDGKKVGGVVLISGGFSEIGEDGKKVQDEIAVLLKQQGIRAIGPNALSPINSHANFTISFTDVLKLPRGNVSFIFQSGMYEPRFNWMISDFHIKLSKLMDLGNKMDLTEVDALEYLAQDKETEAIFMHLEAIKGDGRRFFQLIKEAARIKPVVVLKGGRSEAGARAALSHTGSLARANDVVFDAALKQAGAIRVDTLDDFLYLAKAFGYLPLPRGNRVVVGTFPGGEAVLATDVCSQQGLVMAKPERKTYERLKDTFPSWDINLNPYDFGVVYTFHLMQNNHAAYIEAMADDNNVDCMAIELPPNFFPIKAEDLCKPFTIAQEKGKPLALWALSMLKFDGEVTDYLEDRNIPVFPSAAITIRCLGALNRYRMWRESL